MADDSRSEEFREPAPTSGLAVASLVLGILGMSCFPYLAAIPAIICGHVAWSRIRRSAGRLGGSGLALAGAILGYLGLIYGIFALAIMAGMFLPALARARGKAREVKCQSNLKLMATALMMYQDAYNGALPPALTDPALAAYLKAPNVLNCPEEDDAKAVSYELVPKGRYPSGAAAATTPLVQDTAARHHGKRMIGFCDGHVAAVQEGSQVAAPTFTEALTGQEGKVLQFADEGFTLTVPAGWCQIPPQPGSEACLMLRRLNPEMYTMVIAKPKAETKPEALVELAMAAAQSRSVDRKLTNDHLQTVGGWSGERFGVTMKAEKLTLSYEYWVSGRDGRMFVMATWTAPKDAGKLTGELDLMLKSLAFTDSPEKPATVAKPAPPVTAPTTTPTAQRFAFPDFNFAIEGLTEPWVTIKAHTLNQDSVLELTRANPTLHLLVIAEELLDDASLDVLLPHVQAKLKASMDSGDFGPTTDVTAAIAWKRFSAKLSKGQDTFCYDFWVARWHGYFYQVILFSLVATPEEVAKEGAVFMKHWRILDPQQMARKPTPGAPPAPPVSLVPHSAVRLPDPNTLIRPTPALRQWPPPAQPTRPAPAAKPPVVARPAPPARPTLAGMPADVAELPPTAWLARGWLPLPTVVNFAPGAKLTEALPAGGGQLLVLVFDRAPEVRLWDVAKSAWAGELALPAGAGSPVVAADQDCLYVVTEAGKKVQRLALTPALTEEKTVDLKGQTIRNLVAGHAARKEPLLARSGFGFLLLNPETLEATPTKVPGETYDCLLRAAANGRVFTFWRPGLSPEGARVVSMTNGEAKLTVAQHATLGYLAPNADGSCICTNLGGIRSGDLAKVLRPPQAGVREHYLPAVTGELTLCPIYEGDAQSPEPRLLFLSFSPEAGFKVVKTCHGLTEMKNNQHPMRFHKGELPTEDRRYYYLGTTGRLITLPYTANAMMIRDLPQDQLTAPAP